MLRQRKAVDDVGAPATPAAGQRATDDLAALGPLHATITLLRMLLPLVAIAAMVMAGDDERGRRAFWHCLPFASAGIAAAVVKFGTQKLWSDERPPARALQSWQLQQAVVPAVQLGALAFAVIFWDAEYDLGTPDPGYLSAAVALGVAGAGIHLVFPTVCAGAKLIDAASPSPAPRLRPYPVGFPAPRHRCRSGGQAAVIGMIAGANSLVLPLVDEIFFRSFVDDRLAEHFGWTVGGLATAVLWGALHSSYPFEWLYTAAFGLGLQALVEHPSERTEIITAAVVAHLVRNVLLSTYGVATRNWYLLEL